MTALNHIRRRVLVVEPQRLVRQALVTAIDSTPGLTAVDAATADRGAAVAADALLVSARALENGWGRLLDRVRAPAGPSPVVLVTDPGPVEPSVDRRGLVVVSRHTPLGAVTECLRAGGSCVRTLPTWHEPRGSADRLFTSRERQVLGLLASGLSPAQLARALSITTYTARDHIKSIRTKLDRPTTMAAVLEAIRLGMLRVNDN
jgi:DNA-binding NarL/FixJ family response regulator